MSFITLIIQNSLYLWARHLQPTRCLLVCSCWRSDDSSNDSSWAGLWCRGGSL